MPPSPPPSSPASTGPLLLPPAEDPDIGTIFGGTGPRARRADSTPARSAESMTQAAAMYFAQLSEMRVGLEKYCPEPGSSLSRSSAIALATELGRVFADDDEMEVALIEMDEDGNGQIDPFEFEAWYKRQVMQSAPTPQGADVATVREARREQVPQRCPPACPLPSATAPPAAADPKGGAAGEGGA